MKEQRALDTIIVMGLIDWMPNQTLIYEGSDREYPVSESGKSLVIRVAARLFDEALMVPGELSTDGFSNWPGAAKDWLARAESEFERFQWHSIGGRLLAPAHRARRSTGRKNYRSVLNRVDKGRRGPEQREALPGCSGHP
jgi:hypothetical protein